MKYSSISFFNFKYINFEAHDNIFELHQNVMNKINILAVGKHTFDFRKDMNIYTKKETQVSSEKETCNIMLFGHKIDRLRNLKSLYMQKRNKIFYHIGKIHENNFNTVAFEKEYMFCCDLMRSELKRKDVRIFVSV